jgi:hypothetical protein
MLWVSPVPSVRHHDGRNGLKSLYGFLQGTSARASLAFSDLSEKAASLGLCYAFRLR